MRNRYSDSEVALFVGGPLHGEVREVRPAPVYESVRPGRPEWREHYSPDAPLYPSWDTVAYDRQRMIDLDGEPLVLMVCRNPGKFEPRSLVRTMWEVVT